MDAHRGLITFTRRLVLSLTFTGAPSFTSGSNIQHNTDRQRSGKWCLCLDHHERNVQGNPTRELDW